MKQWRKLAAASGVASALTVVAMAAQANDKQSDQRFCADVTALNSHLSNLQNISASTSATDVRTTTGRVEADAKDMKKVTDKMKTPAATQLENAVNQLQQTVSGVSTDATLAKMRDQIKSDARDALDAGQKVAAESRCGK